jgi:MiaB-like tRNA modifying enzyme
MWMKCWYLLKNKSRLLKIKDILLNKPSQTSVQFAKEMGVDLGTCYRYLKLFHPQVDLKKVKNKYTIRIISKQRIYDKYKQILKEADIFDGVRELAKKLKREGYTLPEISKEIFTVYNYKILPGRLSQLTKHIKREEEGQRRFDKTISIFRRKAVLINLKSNKKLFKKHWKRIIPIIAKKALLVNTKKILDTGMSVQKIRLLGHAIFDGSISKTKNNYYVVSYTNIHENLINQFISDVKMVYGLKPTDVRLRKDGTYVARFCSINLVGDLLRLKKKLPYILGANELKASFLRSFWDDEGCVNWRSQQDKVGYVHITRQLEGFSKDKKILELLAQTHKSLGVATSVEGNKIIIRDRTNLKKFEEKVNFTEGIKVCKGISAFRGLEKRRLLHLMVNDFTQKRHKLYIRTYGCAANQADSELLKASLLKIGYTIVSNQNNAEIIIFNTCSVKGSTEEKIFNALRQIPSDKKIIVTGCLPSTNKQRFDREVNYSALLGSSCGNKIIDAIKAVEDGKKIVDLSQNMPSCLMPQINKEIGILVVSYGCLSSCAYCSTKLARGNLRSYKINDLIKKCKYLVKHGAKKILLTAQDTGVYGLDIGTNLPELLKAIATLKGDFKIRIGMMNPKYALRYVDDLIDIYKNPKIIKFIHIPIQAGSDEVLRRMNRNYTADDFKKLIKKLKAGVPQIIISTDIICGFPEETEEDFQKTINLVKEIKPEVINISKFYPRPGTKAAAMKQLTTNVIKERSRRISELVKVMRRFNKQITV